MVVSIWNLSSEEVAVGRFLGLAQLASLAKLASNTVTEVLSQKVILRKTKEDISMCIYTQTHTTH